MMNTTDLPPVIPRSIRCSLDRRDILRCRLWVLTHNRKLLTILLLMCMAVPVLTFHKSDSPFPPVLFFIVYFLVGTVFMIVFEACVLVGFHVLWLFINPNRGVAGEHEFEIRDDGLWNKTSVSESLHRWAGFHKIARSRNYLFVFVTDNIVHYIPLRIFASREDAESFETELRKRANL